jgi:hypothetical protein
MSGPEEFKRCYHLLEATRLILSSYSKACWTAVPGRDRKHNSTRQPRIGDIHCASLWHWLTSLPHRSFSRVLWLPFCLFKFEPIGSAKAQLKLKAFITIMWIIYNILLLTNERDPSIFINFLDMLPINYTTSKVDTIRGNTINVQ